MLVLPPARPYKAEAVVSTVKAREEMDALAAQPGAGLHPQQPGEAVQRSGGHRAAAGGG